MPKKTVTLSPDDLELEQPIIYYIEEDRQIVLSSNAARKSDGDNLETRDDSLYAILGEWFGRETPEAAALEELERVAMWTLKEIAKVRAKA